MAKGAVGQSGLDREQKSFAGNQSLQDSHIHRHFRTLLAFVGNTWPIILFMIDFF
jgi:hypothetical protein